MGLNIFGRMVTQGAIRFGSLNAIKAYGGGVGSAQEMLRSFIKGAATGAAISVVTAGALYAAYDANVMSFGGPCRRRLKLPRFWPVRISPGE